MHRQLVAIFRGAHQVVDVGEIDLRIDALGEQVQAERDEIDVAGALAVAEQGALDALRARQHRELRRGDAGAAIVVRMQADDGAVAVLELAAEILDLVGVDVRRRHLDRRRQVEDAFVGRGRLPHIHHRLAHLDRVVDLGAGEALRRILEHELGVGRMAQRVVAHPFRALDGDALDAFHVLAEHDAALQRRGRVVDVHDRAPGADQAFIGARDQMLARLRQHLDGDVGGNEVFLDQLAQEVEIGLRGGREADLDLLVAHAAERLEHAQLALRPHRLDQRLVAVAQIDAAPDRRLVDDARGPSSVRQVDRAGTVGTSWLGRYASRNSFGSVSLLVDRDVRSIGRRAVA